MFVDIVSKNGNLLVNSSATGHGEPDSDEMAFLQELIDWQQINSEAIQGSRSWKLYGEGPSIHAPKMGILSVESSKVRPLGYSIYHKGRHPLCDCPRAGHLTEGFLITSLADGSTNYPSQIGKVEIF